MLKRSETPSPRPSWSLKYSPKDIPRTHGIGLSRKDVQWWKHTGMNLTKALRHHGSRKWKWGQPNDIACDTLGYFEWDDIKSMDLAPYDADAEWRAADYPTEWEQDRHMIALLRQDFRKVRWQIVAQCMDGPTSEWKNFPV